MKEKNSLDKLAEILSNQLFFVKIIMFIGLIFIFIYSSELIIPVIFSFLFYFLLYPLVDFLEKIYIPRFLGSFFVPLFFLILVGYGFYFLSVQADEWINNAPEFVDILDQKLSAISAFISKPIKFFSYIYKHIQHLLNLPTDQKMEHNWVKLIFSNTWTFLLELGTMLILLYFLLASKNFFLKRVVSNLITHKDKRDANRIVIEIENKVWKFLFWRIIVNIGVAIIVSLILFAFQVPNPILWGVMAGILEFIPFVGAIISLIIITLVSIISFNNPWYIASIPFVFFVFISIEGNLFVPYIFGKSFFLNKVAIVLWIFFMTWLWGALGSFLAVPTLMTLKIILDHINKDNFISNLSED